MLGLTTNWRVSIQPLSMGAGDRGKVNVQGTTYFNRASLISLVLSSSPCFVVREGAVMQDKPLLKRLSPESPPG
jgi:hypothetical protein